MIEGGGSEGEREQERERERELSYYQFLIIKKHPQNDVNSPYTLALGPCDIALYLYVFIICS